MKKLYSAILSALLIAACSPDPGNVPKIAESQHQALDKAKGIEAAVNQGGEEQRTQIDEQSR